MPKPNDREREVEDDRDDVANVEVDTDTSMLNDVDEDEEDEVAKDKPRRAARQGADDEDEDEEDERLSHEDDEEEDERPRGRRSRRNRARRLREQESQQQIHALAGMVSTLQRQIDEQSRSQLGLAAGDIDAQMQHLHGQLRTIEAAHAKAVTDGDGASAAEAMRLSREAERRLDNLAYERRRLEPAARQPTSQQRQQPTAQAPDPRAASFANKFMADHDWFDPDDASDEDSQIVVAIDRALANEGYQPNTKQFWKELRRRVKARGLGDSDMDDDDDDGYQEREAPRRRTNSGGLPPRSRAGAGQGRRESGFKLDQHMKDALDAEGLLDEKNLTKEQKEYRKRLVTKWRDGTAEARRNPSPRR